MDETDFGASKSRKKVAQGYHTAIVVKQAWL
jgi:hypothetical protein